jgi:hypothetical protein
MKQVTFKFNGKTYEGFVKEEELKQYTAPAFGSTGWFSPNGIDIYNADGERMRGMYKRGRTGKNESNILKLDPATNQLGTQYKYQGRNSGRVNNVAHLISIN